MKAAVSNGFRCCRRADAKLEFVQAITPLGELPLWTRASAPDRGRLPPRAALFNGGRVILDNYAMATDFPLPAPMIDEFSKRDGYATVSFRTTRSSSLDTSFWRKCCVRDIKSI